MANGNIVIIQIYYVILVLFFLMLYLYCVVCLIYLEYSYYLNNSYVAAEVDDLRYSTVEFVHAHRSNLSIYN